MKLYLSLLFTLASFIGLVGEASAALDTSIATGFTAVQTDFSALMALAYPWMISIASALLIYNLVRFIIKKH